MIQIYTRHLCAYWIHLLFWQTNIDINIFYVVFINLFVSYEIMKKNVLITNFFFIKSKSKYFKTYCKLNISVVFELTYVCI